MSYKKTTIGAHCSVTSSKRFHASERTKEGVPFYCSKEIIQKVKGEDVTECDYISEDAYKSVKEKYGVPQVGDLLITTRGTYGVPYIYKDYDKFYFADGNLTWLKDFDDELDVEYLYYWINSYEGQKKIDAIAKGTAQKAVPIATLKQIEIEIPDISTQKKVVCILKAYDELIENNQKQIKLLEEAAQRLYKEWFVDLRFPGYEGTEIVDGVPEGWRYGSITDISICFDKSRKPLSSIERENQAKIYPYYGAASLMDYVEKYIFDGVYLLFGEDGTVITSDGTPMLQYVWGKFWVNNHAHVFQGKEEYSTEFLYMLCKHMKVSDVVTGVAQPKISQGRLNEKKILLPDKDLAAKYSKSTEPIFKRIRRLNDEVLMCKEARDRLLPKLMSGEIEV